MRSEKELLHERLLLEVQELRDIVTEKLISKEEWELRMRKRIDRANISEDEKDKMKERYNTYTK